MPDLKFDAENCDKSLEIIGKAFEDCCSYNIDYQDREAARSMLSQYLEQVVYYTKIAKDTGPLKKLADYTKLDSMRKADDLYVCVQRACSDNCRRTIHGQDALHFLCGSVLRQGTARHDGSRGGLRNLLGIDFAYCLYNMLRCYTDKTQHKMTLYEQTLYEQARDLLIGSHGSTMCNFTNDATLCLSIDKLKYWIPEIEIDNSALQGYHRSRIGPIHSRLIPIIINSASPYSSFRLGCADDKLECQFVKVPERCNFEKVRSFIAAPRKHLQDMCARVIIDSLVAIDDVGKLLLPDATKQFIRECHDSTNIDYTYSFSCYFGALADELAAPSTGIEAVRAEALSLQDQHAVAQ